MKKNSKLFKTALASLLIFSALSSTVFAQDVSPRYIPCPVGPGPCSYKWVTYKNTMLPYHSYECIRCKESSESHLILVCPGNH